MRGEQSGAQPHGQVSGWMSSSLYSAVNQPPGRDGGGGGCFLAAACSSSCGVPWASFTENGRHGVIGCELPVDGCCTSVLCKVLILCTSTLDWKGHRSREKEGRVEGERGTWKGRETRGRGRGKGGGREQDRARARARARAQIGLNFEEDRATCTSDIHYLTSPMCLPNEKRPTIPPPTTDHRPSDHLSPWTRGG